MDGRVAPEAATAVGQAHELAIVSCLSTSQIDAPVYDRTSDLYINASHSPCFGLPGGLRWSYSSRGCLAQRPITRRKSTNLSPQAANALVNSILDNLTCRELASLGLRADNEQLLAIQRHDQAMERRCVA